jgi:hypothetical protein
LVADSGNPALTGICCINLDHRVSDAQVAAIFEAAAELRWEFQAAAQPDPAVQMYPCLS